MWGAVRENLRRRSSPAYTDGIASPASVCVAEQRKNNTCAYSQEYSSYGSTRPSPRVISNVLFRQIESVVSERKINDFHVHFGQVSSVKKHLTKIRKTRWFCRKIRAPWRLWCFNRFILSIITKPEKKFLGYFKISTVWKNLMYVVKFPG